ncbi:Nucleoside phosphorylase [Actinacidiphila yanglinensis]|uniref:Nucleoside phosphorylase n=1 Tax=Actinacidiphila yanglinensis TaxID=310779 RepID=A0A1H5VP33_9ACTN|nr:5'-methylthioadenosine/S-adenosylhomocysteine nucleosidase [Actinacidiphila yanglinensis]SEF89085.1 Nucleoside phosphorylase [Actinacidiphila yanglinensis]
MRENGNGGGESADVYVMTAIDVEFRAVLGQLAEGTVRRPRDPELPYRIGEFACSEAGRGPLRVAVHLAGPGNEAAAVELQRAVARLRPSVVLMVGVAGGRKDVGLGDVVAAESVYEYERGRDEESRFVPRPRTWSSNYHLVQHARAVAAFDTWHRRIEAVSPQDGDPSTAHPPSAPRAFVGALAAGGKLVAHGRSATAQLLDRTASDTLAVEMEGSGFLRAAYANEEVRALVVRGVSDLLGDKDGEHDRYWQPVAARHAAAFAFELLAQYPPPRRPGSPGWRRPVVPSAPAPPSAPAAPASLGAAELARLASLLLQVPGISSPASWQLLLDMLPEIGATVSRHGTARHDALALLRACEAMGRFGELCDALDLLWPGYSVLTRFREGVAGRP